MNKYLNIFYKPYWKTHNYVSWLYGVYSNNKLSEYDFYFDKFSNDERDYSRPHYSVWQKIIYKKLKSTFKLTNKNIHTLINTIGIKKLNLLDKYKFSIEITNLFNENEFNEIISFYGYKKLNNIYKINSYKQVKSANKFYYLTHNSAFEQIKLYGIIPSLVEDNYPKRIYLWDIKTNINDIKNFGKKLNRFHNRNEDDIIILEIDIPENFCINLYQTKHNKNSYFTLEPIRLSWIKNIQPIQPKINDINKITINNINNSIEVIEK